MSGRRALHLGQVRPARTCCASAATGLRPGQADPGVLLSARVRRQPIVGELLAKLLLAELADPRLRRLVDEYDVIWQLPFRKPLNEEAEKVLAGERLSRPDYHAGQGSFHPLGVWDCYDRGLSHQRVVMIVFSRSTELIHSPPGLTRSFVRSTRRRYPGEEMVARSPVRSQPSGETAHRDRWCGSTAGQPTGRIPRVLRVHGRPRGVRRGSSDRRCASRFRAESSWRSRGPAHAPAR
jgi:hypothetical protein